MVTKEELEYMLQRTELLREITHAICTEQIFAYDTMIEQQNQNKSKLYREIDDDKSSSIAADEQQRYLDNNEKPNNPAK